MRFAMHTIQIHKIAMISIPVMPLQTLATMITIGFFPDWFISFLSGLVLAESDERSIAAVVTVESVERSIAVVDSCTGSESKLLCLKLLTASPYLISCASNLSVKIANSLIEFTHRQQLEGEEQYPVLERWTLIAV